MEEKCLRRATCKVNINTTGMGYHMESFDYLTIRRTYFASGVPRILDERLREITFKCTQFPYPFYSLSDTQRPEIVKAKPLADEQSIHSASAAAAAAAA
ncbi:Hypothetical predicted protein [Octopus vulgaris]|uniref:Uncharacterized protein n=1 Tax=Octopus vulgaris TaxID=6645 RepID=A0AA36FCB2_OCTVU|nr:Hypothetical predicted protein [Octopus vulgaris]